MTPTEDLLDRLEDRAVPLETADPEAGIGDMRPLADVFDEATVVGMGEATHGTREFFQFKHRLVRLLVEELDFRLFGLESNFTETLTINDYVLRGDGDPVAALDGIYFWTWNTEEVLALIDWLREYNEGRPASDRVKFYGFDAQYTEGPAEAIVRYLREVDPEFLEAMRGDLSALADDGLRIGPEEDDDAFESRLDAAVTLVASLEDRLRERQNAYISESSKPEWELAGRHVRTLEQVVEQLMAGLDGGHETVVAARDEHMAENVSWILDHEPSEKMALWAHNEHVKKGEARGHWGSATTMGEFLHREFGERYYALGFEFGAGSYQAYPGVDEGKDDDGNEEEYELEEFSVAEPFDGSLPETLSELNVPLCFLDFESASEDARVQHWLEREQRVHSIGALSYSDEEKNLSRYALADEFDGLLYVDETSSAVPIDDVP